MLLFFLVLHKCANMALGSSKNAKDIKDICPVGLIDSQRETMLCRVKSDLKRKSNNHQTENSKKLAPKKICCKEGLDMCKKLLKTDGKIEKSLANFNSSVSTKGSIRREPNSIYMAKSMSRYFDRGRSEKKNPSNTYLENLRRDDSRFLINNFSKGNNFDQDSHMSKVLDKSLEHCGSQTEKSFTSSIQDPDKNDETPYDNFFEVKKKKLEKSRELKNKMKKLEEDLMEMYLELFWETSRMMQEINKRIHHIDFLEGTFIDQGIQRNLEKVKITMFFELRILFDVTIESLTSFIISRNNLDTSDFFLSDPNMFISNNYYVGLLPAAQLKYKRVIKSMFNIKKADLIIYSLIDIKNQAKQKVIEFDNLFNIME